MFMEENYVFLFWKWFNGLYLTFIVFFFLYDRVLYFGGEFKSGFCF